MTEKHDKNFLDFLKRCTQKDKDAWDSFVDKYSKIIYSYIIKTLRRYNYSLQNDVVNEIFDKIFLSFLENECRRLKNFRGLNERSFVAYLREISFHITVDFLREQKEFVELEKIEHKFAKEFQFEELDHRRLKEIILAIGRSLPERHKYLFHLIYVEERDLSDIAKIMNINSNALHQLKFRMMSNIIKISKENGLYSKLKMFVLPLAA